MAKETEYLIMDDTDNLNDREYAELLKTLLSEGAVTYEMLSDSDMELLGLAKIEAS